MKMIKLDQRSKLTQLKTIAPIKEKICITTQKGRHVISKDDISHLSADSNYTTIHYRGESIMVSQTIGIILEKINLPHFLRIHKSYVLNLDQVRLIDNAFTYAITECNKQLPISRAKKSLVKEALKKRFDH